MHSRTHKDQGSEHCLPNFAQREMYEGIAAICNKILFNVELVIVEGATCPFLAHAFARGIRVLSARQLRAVSPVIGRSRRMHNERSLEEKKKGGNNNR